MIRQSPESFEARVSEIASDMTAEDHDIVQPPADLWDRIQASVDAERPTSGGGTAGGGGAPVVSLDARRNRWAGPLAIAASVALLAGVGALILAGPTKATQSKLVASATLGRLEATQGVGTAKLVRQGGTLHLLVKTNDMATPPTGSDYELWLVDKLVTNPRSLGAVTGRVTGRNTIDVVVPRSIDPKRFPVVDISVEPTDGNHKHSGHSVMRGTLA